MKVKFFTIIFMVLLASRLHAEVFALKATKIELKVPAEWQKSLNFLQNPLTLFGPTSRVSTHKKVQRAAWIFSDAPKGEENLNKKKLAEKQDDYFSGRLKWMAKRGATLVDKIPYSVYKTKQRVEIHQIGVTYRLGESTYTEESLFFICSDVLVNISRLTPEKDKQKVQADYQAILDSLSCVN